MHRTRTGVFIAPGAWGFTALVGRVEIPHFLHFSEAAIRRPISRDKMIRSLQRARIGRTSKSTVAFVEKSALHLQLQSGSVTVAVAVGYLTRSARCIYLCTHVCTISTHVPWLGTWKAWTGARLSCVPACHLFFPEWPRPPRRR